MSGQPAQALGLSGRGIALGGAALLMAVVFAALEYQSDSTPITTAPLWESGFDPCSEAGPANMRRARQHFELGAKQLDEAMTELAALDEAALSQDPRLDRIGGIVAGLNSAIRELMPIEDYPRAIYGYAKVLRGGPVMVRPDQGELALLEGAFTNTLFEIAPASREVSADYVAALTDLWAMVSIDEREPGSAPDVVAILAQAQALQRRYQPFAAALRAVLGSPRFEQSLATQSQMICGT